MKLNVEYYNSVVPSIINNKYILEIFVAMEQTMVELGKSDSANIPSGLTDKDAERLQKNIDAIGEKIALVKAQLAAPVDVPELKPVHNVNPLEEMPATDNFDVWAICDSLALFGMNFISSGQSNKATSYIHPEDFTRLEKGIDEIKYRLTTYLPAATPLDLPATTSETGTVYPKPGVNPTPPE
jgi:hypothetical protein